MSISTVVPLLGEEFNGSHGFYGRLAGRKTSVSDWFHNATIDCYRCSENNVRQRLSAYCKESTNTVNFLALSKMSTVINSLLDKEVGISVPAATSASPTGSPTQASDQTSRHRATASAEYRHLPHRSPKLVETFPPAP